MASLLEQWKRRDKVGGNSGFAAIRKMPKALLAPLSYGQEQLWFLQKLHPDNPFYNYCECYNFEGKLDSASFEKALEYVLKDFDVLRSIYIPGKDGEIIQTLNESLTLNLTIHDISNLRGKDLEHQIESIGLKDASTSFSLEKGPLYKFSLVKCSHNEHRLFLTLNHIITDKWSMMVFRKHLAKYYSELSSNKPLSKLRPSIQYVDYAYHQKKIGVPIAQLDFWKKRLAGNVQSLLLPHDFLRPTTLSYRGSLQTQKYSWDFSQDILALAKKMQATPYVIMLTAYYILLHKLSKQTTIAVGSPVANRNAKELEGLMGFFNDTIVLQTELEEAMNFDRLVTRVKEVVLEAFANKDVPFNILVKELMPKRKLNINPFFQVMFIYHKVPEKPFFSEDLKVMHHPSEVGVAKFDLTLYIAEEDGQISSTIEYMSDLFEEHSILSFQEQLKAVLERVIIDQQVDISQIEVRPPSLFKIDDVSKKEIVTANNWAYEGNFAIHEIINNIAVQFPSKVAVSCGPTSITYQDLLDRSTAIATKIVQKTKGENQIVGLCLDRSVDLVIGLLAILKAGAAYLPLDPEYPKHRIAYMLKDAEVNFVLTEEGYESRFNTNTVAYISMIPPSSTDSNVVFPETTPDHLAYVIYTSGSSGKPKGVPITHGNIVNSTRGRLDFYPNQPTAFLLLSSIAFDSSKAGLFWTLCSGGNLVVSEKRLEQDMQLLTETIRTHQVSHTLMLPTLYDVILDHAQVACLASLNTIIVAGEACTKHTAEKHFKVLPKTALYNEYGPTEATVWCMAHRVEPQDLERSIPIGKAVANAQILLLDEALNQVPEGETGELFIGGPGLSKAYINRPKLTKAAFIDHPFEKTGDAKLYRTGDFARQRKDGSFEFLGRSDDQVKIRGHRIELDEIENVLHAIKEVEQAVVLVVEEEATNRDADIYMIVSKVSKKLVAYVKLQTDEASVLKISSILKEQLPNYMVPSSIQIVGNIPVLPNGKVDKNTLRAMAPTPMGQVKTREENQSTFDSAEQQLVHLWEQVLDISPIGIDDNFFEMGGDSILSIQIISKARKLGLELSADQLFEHQTISELSRVITPNMGKRDAIETTLIQIWEEVLQTGPIGLNDNFFEIGGDSILSIQIISKARKQGIELTANHLFENQTIAELCVSIKKNPNIGEVETGIILGSVAMTPIQHWFFETHKNAPHFWNQGYRIIGLSSLKEKELLDIMSVLVKQHDALRSNFYKEQKKWKATIGQSKGINFLVYKNISDLDKQEQTKYLTKIIKDTQENLDLSKDTLFKCIYLYTGQSTAPICLLLGHHLVIDAVSWQIIIDDFIYLSEQINHSKILSLPKKTSSIQTWSNYMVNLDLEDELPFWKEHIKEVKSLPTDFIKKSDTIHESDIDSIDFRMDAEQTDILLNSANEAFGTKIVELLITGMLETLSKWSKIPEISIGIEGHGRETKGTDIDLSGTAGWFTSFFPVRFNGQNRGNRKSNIINIKETMRNIPRGGIGYGILRYIKNQLETVDYPQVTFNYLGSQMKVSSRGVELDFLLDNVRHPLSERTYMFEVNTWISEKGELNGRWSYSRVLHKHDTIKKLVDNLLGNLSSISSFCTNAQEKTYTPSDFPDAGLSQTELDDLLGSLE
ncbi:MAG: amino acid adenylation domain-containing protein [Croceivirga sp.]